MNKSLFVILSLILVSGCSGSKYEFLHDYQQQVLDSTKVKASLQSIDYPWNTEGYLVDLLRRNSSSEPPFIDPFSVIMSFNGIEADTFKFYFMLNANDSRVKIAEAYIDQGFYSLGFQKLEVETGLYFIEVSGSAIDSERYIFVAN
jgi:hypothetical protein